VARRKKSAPLTGEVRSVGRGGDGAVETPRGIRWVPGVFPGERVRIRPEGKGARLLEVERPHPARRKPPCPVADTCGGCPWMALEPAVQRELEATWGREMAARLGFEGEVPVLADGDEAYRRRARLAWNHRGGATRMGYRLAGSRRLVDVERCLVQQPALQASWTALRSLADVLRDSGEIRLYRHGDAAAALLHADEPQPPEVYDRLRALVAEGRLAGVGLSIQGGVPATFGETSERYPGPDGEPLDGPPGGFSQAHDPLSLQLARDAASRALAFRPERVLELHAGHGSFTVLLAREAEVTAVEISQAASDALRANLEARGLTAKAVAEDAERYPASFEGYDVVVLDPPRLGAKGAVERLVAGKARPPVVYVSCDLGTLERDLRALREGGYELSELRLYDLFPQTARVEALAVLTPTP